MAGKGPPAVLRTVTSHLSLDVRTPLEILLSVAVADGAYDRSEILSVRHEDGPLDVAEIKMAHGGRMHRVLSPAGRLVVDYQATVTGHERGKKIHGLKFKPKRGYKRRTGHRQELTRIRITSIKS